ncbi:hypothetical protein GCM10010201_07130 [Pilimelia columellifera subsp. columellifera]|uniref:Uncharacterized protein n=1 Tax=Pilimelia columellifera subsp. columellifera TaxID=706583 RepID=A0ABN3N3L0_9ACTN
MDPEAGARQQRMATGSPPACGQRDHLWITPACAGPRGRFGAATRAEKREPEAYTGQLAIAF